MKKMVQFLLPALGLISDCANSKSESPEPNLTSQMITERYRLYTPSVSANRPLPLLIMIHGCDQNAEDFERGTEMNRYANEKGFFVLYPDQLRGRASANCWRWFDPENRRRDSGEIAEIKDMVDQVSKQAKIDKDKVYVAGLSSGAATAAAFAACYPELVRGGAFHSGPALNVADNQWAAVAALRFGPNPWLDAWASDTCRPQKSSKKFLVIQGDRDSVVNPRHAARLVEQFSGESVVEKVPKLGLHLEKMGNEKFKIEARDQTVLITVEGMKHAWAGGTKQKYFDPRAFSASELIARFLIGGESVITP